MGWLNRRRREEVSEHDDDAAAHDNAERAAYADFDDPETSGEPSWTVEVPDVEGEAVQPRTGGTSQDLLSKLMGERPPVDDELIEMPNWAVENGQDLSTEAAVQQDYGSFGDTAGGAVPEPEGDGARGALSHAVDDPDGYDRPTESTQESAPMALDSIIQQLLAIDGATGAAVIDSESGMALAQGGSPGFDLGVAAAGNSNVVRAKLATMKEIGLDGKIDDILITLDAQYHLINVLDTAATRGLFIYLVLDRSRANLALARHRLRAIAPTVEI